MQGTQCYTFITLMLVDYNYEVNNIVIKNNNSICKDGKYLLQYTNWGTGTQ
jgi:hypothetical protein